VAAATTTLPGVADGGAATVTAGGVEGTGTTTVTTTAFEVDAAKFDIAPKLAEIEFAPTGNEVMCNTATPLTTAPVPIDVPPLRKLIVPLGTGVPLLNTVAVNVTLAPEVGAVIDEASVVAVLA
jgi:hypothetical protein